MQTLKKIANFFYKKRYYILGGICLAGSIYYFGKIYQTDLTQTKVCYFFQALSNKKIKEVILKGNYILFKSELSQWFITNVEGIPKTNIFTIIQSTPNLIYSCQSQDKEAYQQLFLVAGSCAIISYNYIKQKLWSQKKNVNLLKPVFFNQIYGNQQIKEKMGQIIDFMKNPQKYLKIGARMRRGILLYGPPGTGKTMIARATAFQSGVQFLYCSASEFQQMYVGVGPKRIRQLFDLARSKKNGCILFIDEFDAIGSRSNGSGSADAQRNSTINQLLTQMDGFFQTNNIVVMAATNRQHMIDLALLRPGRFDTKIKTQLPNLQQRIGIMKIHLLEKRNNVSQEGIQIVAKNTAGKSGAQIQQIVNESAYIALKKQKQIIEDVDVISSLQAYKKLK